MDENRVPIEHARQSASDLFGIILSSMERMELSLVRVQTSVDTNTRRMDTLIETTNHRLDEFRDEMARREAVGTARQETFESVVSTLVAGKANRNELITDVFRKNRAVQAILAAIFLSIAPMAVDHWGLFLERLKDLF